MLTFMAEADRSGFGAALQRAMAGRPREHLAEPLGITPQAVSKWYTGDSAPREADRVFLIEELLELPAGTLSRFLGYLPVEAVTTTTVTQAIEADPALDDRDRRVLLATYREMVEGHRTNGRANRR